MVFMESLSFVSVILDADSEFSMASELDLDLVVPCALTVHPLLRIWTHDKERT